MLELGRHHSIRPHSWPQIFLGRKYFYTCTKRYGGMNANNPVISQPITCKLSCKNRNSDQIIPGNVEIFYNCLKLPFFGLKIRLLFTDLFRIRYVYFGSGSDPAKSFGFLRIRFRFRIRIRNTAGGSVDSGHKFASTLRRSGIRIRINEKSRLWIRLKVKEKRLRILINVIRIRNPG